jgi:hypothetical protein
MGNGVRPRSMKSPPADRVCIDQVLHGYRGGHRRLAGSVELDDVSAGQMAVMSDLLTTDVTDAASSYLCGYPLRNANRYVLARTWPAPEMARPGCVWTHSLVLDYAVLTKLADPVRLLALFQRPTPPNIRDYDSRITASISALEASGFVQEVASHGIDPSRARMVLAGLYGGKLGYSVALSRGNPADDEVLTLSAWRQMWPRMRRNFTFATCVSGTMVGLGDGVRLLFSSDRLPADDQKWLDAWHVLARRPGAELLLMDLPTRELTALRQFIWRYSSDALDPRTAGVGLSDVYFHLNRGRQREDLELAADVVHKLFGNPENCRLLKSDFMLGRLHNDSQIDEANAFLAMLSAFRDTPSWVSDDSLAHRLATLPGRTNIVSQILRLVGDTKDNELGGAVIRNVATIMPQEVVASASCNVAVKLRLARLNPDLASVPAFWPRSESDWLYILQNMKLTDANLDALVSATLSEIGEQETVWLLQHEGARAGAAILRHLSRADDTAASHKMQVFRALVRFPTVLRPSLANAGPITPFVAGRLAGAIDESDDEQILDWATWVSIVERSRWTRPLNEELYLAAVLFKVALSAPLAECAHLLRLCFDPIHDAAASDRLDTRTRGELSKRLPFIGWQRNWDLCEKIRIAVARCYLTHGSLDASVLRVTESSQTLRLLLQSIRKEWRGLEPLQELLQRIQSSSEPIEEFRLAALNDAVADAWPFRW